MMDAAAIDFDEATHTYRVGGVIVPGVTSILKPLTDLSGIPRDVLEAKRDLGSRVHRACEYDDDGDLDESTVEDDVRPYLDAWRRFLRESRAVVLENERKVFEPTMRYCGTLDNVIAYDGAKWVVDKKTSIATPMSAGPQTAAYMRALGDPSVTRRAAIRLRPDGTYRFDPLTGADDWAAFFACLTLQFFKESHK